MILQVIKVSGSSLSPRYKDGDFVLVSQIPILLGGIHPGDIIIFDHPLLGKLIKIVERVEAGGNRIFVIGLDADSRDSRVFGAVPRNLVQGKVIWRIPQK
jgi:phage repressor protein C with HTH and peptisase S24 domain